MAKRVPTLKRHEMINLECGFQTFQMFQLWMRVTLCTWNRLKTIEIQLIPTPQNTYGASRRQILKLFMAPPGWFPQEYPNGFGFQMDPGWPGRDLFGDRNPRSLLAQPCGRSTTPFCSKEASTAARSAIATMLLYRYTWGTPVVSLPILETSWSRCFVLKCVRSKRLFSVPSSSTARHKIPILTGENSRCSRFNPHLSWSNPFSRLNPQMST